MDRELPLSSETEPRGTLAPSPEQQSHANGHAVQHSEGAAVQVTTEDSKELGTVNDGATLTPSTAQKAPVHKKPRRPAKDSLSVGVPMSRVRRIKGLMKSPVKPDYINLAAAKKQYPHISSYLSSTFSAERYESPRMVPRAAQHCDHSEDLIEKNIKIVKSLSSLRDPLRDILPDSLQKKGPSGQVQLCSVEERFYKYQEHVRQKLVEQRSEQAAQESSTCPFKPTINQPQPGGKPRSKEQYYKDMLKHQQHTEDKLQRLREQRAECTEQVKAKPTICARSVRLISGKAYNSEPCHERLYQMHKPIQADTMMSSCFTDDLSKDYYDGQGPFDFTPKVNKVSRELIRGKAVEKLLYEDAVRRMRKTHSFEALPTVHPSKNSLRILVKRFLNEYGKTSGDYDLSKGELNYTRYVSMFRSMNLLTAAAKIRNEEIVVLLELWNRLGGESGKVQLKDLKVAMMGIMGYYESWMSNAVSQKFTLNLKQVAQFHARYKLLFENRGTSNLGNIYARVEQSAHASKAPSFMSGESNTHRIEDMLIEQGRKREQRLEQMRAKRNAESLAQCTFKPQLGPLQDPFLKANTTVCPFPRARQARNTLSTSMVCQGRTRLGTQRPQWGKRSLEVPLVQGFRLFKKPRSESSGSDSPHHSDSAAKNEVPSIVVSDLNEANESLEDDFADLKESADFSAELEGDLLEDDTFIIAVEIDDGREAKLTLRASEDPRPIVNEFVQRYGLSQCDCSKLMQHVKEIIRENF